MNLHQRYATRMGTTATGPCPHEAFTADVNVHLDEAARDRRAVITVRCSQCGEAMQWLGVPDGPPSPYGPTCHGTDLQVPIRPITEDPTA